MFFEQDLSSRAHSSRIRKAFEVIIGSSSKRVCMVSSRAMEGPNCQPKVAEVTVASDVAVSDLAKCPKSRSSTNSFVASSGCAVSNTELIDKSIRAGFPGEGSHFRIDIKVTPLSSSVESVLPESSPGTSQQVRSSVCCSSQAGSGGFRSRESVLVGPPRHYPYSGGRRFDYQLRGRTEKKLSEFGQRYSESFTLSVDEADLDPIYVKRQGMDGTAIYNAVNELLRDDSGNLRDIVPKSEPTYLALFPQTQQAAVFIEYKLRGSGFIVEPPQKKNPRFSVPGVDKDMLVMPNFVPDLKQFNKWPANEYLKIIGYARTSGRSDSRSVNLVLESSGFIRGKLDETNGTIIVYGTGKRISDLFIVKLCTNCYKYGHTKSTCWSMRRCKFCNKKYHGSCSAKTSIEHRFCSACNLFGHHVQERQCPSLQYRLDMARRSVAYKYKHIF